jgi:L-2,4-diaminobutyrate decarboxylase
VGGRHYLKFTLLNAEATLEDIAQIITLLRRTGAGLLQSEVSA